MRAAAKRVMVTGAAGMLGGEVVRTAAARGWAIHGVDLRRPEGWDDGMAFTAASLQDWPDLPAALKAVDAVIHVAAIANLDSAPEPVVFANNVTGTSTLAYAAAEAGIRRFVYASSQSALGFSRARTVIPPAYLPVDENHPCHLTEGYGVSKLVGEQVCRTVTYRFGMETASLRFPVIWSPARFAAHVAKRSDDPVQAAKSNWAYIDVRDAARAMVLAVEAPMAEGATVLNISARWPFCDEEVGVLAGRWYGPVERRGPIGEAAPVFAVARAEAVLGFRAAFRWTRDGIEEAGA